MPKRHAIPGLLCFALFFAGSVQASDQNTTHSSPATPSTMPSTIAAFVAEPCTDAERIKDAAKRFWIAVEAEDVAAVRANIDASTPVEQDLADALAELLVAGRSLAVATRDAFDARSGSAEGLLQSSKPDQIDGAMVEFKSADLVEVKIADSVRPLTMRRDSTGNWKIPIDDYLQSSGVAGQPEPDESARALQAALLKKTAATLRSVAERIRAGELESIEKADAAVRDGVQEIIEKFQPASATQPVK